MLSREQKRRIIKQLKQEGAIQKWRPIFISNHFVTQTGLLTTILYDKTNFEDEDSLMFILLHEEGHHIGWSRRDIILAIGEPGGILLVISPAVFGLAGGYFTISLALGLSLMAIALSIHFFNILFRSSDYQDEELRADEYAISELRRIHEIPQPSAVVEKALTCELDALIKRGRSIVDPIRRALPREHPPLLERIENIREKFG